VTLSKLKINCDLGEGFGTWQMGDDEQLMPLIDSANIACGFHAGDASIMRRTIGLARKHKVEIGAHVAYPDLQGFGRRSMQIRGRELIDILQYQIAALDGLARLQGGKVQYVKPHGALYNDMMADPALLTDIMQAVSEWPRNLDLVVMATPRYRKTVELAVEHGLSLRFEAFADRSYTDAGLLVARSKPGAVLDAPAAAEQAKAIMGDALRSQRGKKVKLRADTLCVHGDTPDALAAIQAIRQAIDAV